MVSETRQRIYEYRDKDGNFVQSVGYEIVKETLGHLACAEKASNNDVQEKITASRIAGNAMRVRRFLARIAEEEEENA